MKKKEKYRKMAEDMESCGFHIYGVGNFNLFDVELFELLQIMVEKEGKERLALLKALYERLYEKRMGETS